MFRTFMRKTGIYNDKPGAALDVYKRQINDNPTSQYRIISSKKGMTQDEIQPFLDAQESAKENAKENKETPQIKGVWLSLIHIW